jgi:hypothetical protein
LSKGKKVNEIPSIRPSVTYANDEVKTFTATGPIEPQVTFMTTSVPSLSWRSGNVRRKLYVQLTSEQANKLKSILLGLEIQEAQLQSGRSVSNPVDAVRWIIESFQPEN